MQSWIHVSMKSQKMWVNKWRKCQKSSLKTLIKWPDIWVRKCQTCKKLLKKVRSRTWNWHWSYCSLSKKSWVMKRKHWKSRLLCWNRNCLLFHRVVNSTILVETALRIRNVVGVIWSKGAWKEITLDRCMWRARFTIIITVLEQIVQRTRIAM